MVYTTIMTLKGVVLDHEEMLQIIKEYFPDQYKIYIEYREKCKEDEGIEELSPADEDEVFALWYTEEIEDTEIGIYHNFSECVMPIYKEKLRKSTETLGGLNLFTWPCCSKLACKKWVLGIRLDPPHSSSIDKIFDTVVTLDNWKIEDKDISGVIPDMFKDKEIQTILMLDDCTFCT